MDHRVDPPHDRVELTPDERAALASFERTLGDAPSDGSSRRARAWLTATARRVGRLAPRLVRLSPWLALLGFLALPPAISVSNAAGMVCALAITAALTTWFVTPRGRWSNWIARQTARAEEQQRRRTGGHP
jgi:hypothetical protein